MDGAALVDWTMLPSSVPHQPPGVDVQPAIMRESATSGSPRTLPLRAVDLDLRRLPSNDEWDGATRIGKAAAQHEVGLGVNPPG